MRTDVTHDQLEAMTLGDRVVVMRAGRIEQVGSPEDVYRRPRTRFVADFVGIPNVLEGTVRGVTGDEVAVDTVIGTLKTRGWRSDRAGGSQCTVAVRPTLLALQPDENGGGRVIRSVFQGSSRLDLVDLHGTRIAIESFAEDRHAPGSAVTVRPAGGRCSPCSTTRGDPATYVTSGFTTAERRRIESGA